MNSTFTRPQYSINLEDALTGLFSRKGFISAFPTKKVFAQSSKDITACIGHDQLYTSVKAADKTRQIDSLCQEIESSFNQSLQLIAEANPSFDCSKISSTVSVEEEKKIVDTKVANKAKRIRRKPEELAMNNICPYFGCDKVYSSKASLKLHCKLNHSENDALKPVECIPAEHITIKKGIKLERVFSKAHVEKLESRAYASTTNETTSDKSSQDQSHYKQSMGSLSTSEENCPISYFSDRALLGKRKNCENIFDFLDRCENIKNSSKVSDVAEETEQVVADDYEKIINQFEEESTKMDSQFESESFFYSPDCESAYVGNMFDFSEVDALVEHVQPKIPGDIYDDQKVVTANPDIFLNFDNEDHETDDITDRLSIFSSDDAIDHVSE